MPKNKTPDEFSKSQAASWLQSAYNHAKQSSILDFERFARYYKLFRNYQYYRNYRGLSNLFVPEPYRIVRKKTAKLANAVRSVEVTAETANNTDQAKIGTHLLNYLRRKLNWFMMERSAIQESRIVGLSWLKITWLLDKEEEDKPWKGFDVKMCTADKILLPPGTTMQDVFDGTFKWLIHEYETDLAQLELNPNYDKDAMEMMKLRGGSHELRTPLYQSRLMNQAKSEVPDSKSPKHRIVEFWGKHKFEEDKEEKNYLIVVADGSIVLRMDENPYMDVLDVPVPFVPFVANPVGQELFPIGDLEPAESLFNELNDSRNQRMDTVTLNIDPMKEVLRGANIDPKELVARKGWIVHSNIPNGIRTIPPDMAGVRASIEEEKNIRGDIQQVTGVIDFNPGSDVQAGVEIDTARGAIIAKGEADALTEDDLQILKMSLRMFYRIVLSYAQEFLDRGFTMRVLEEGVEKFYQVDKMSIEGQMDLDIEMKTLQDKTTDQQLKLLLLNQARQTPGAAVGKFFTDALESFYEHVNIEEYYQPPQPTPAEGPKVSISLKGDLNPLEADEIFKTIPGVDKGAADPLARQELREAMRGNLPEHTESQKHQIEMLNQQHQLLQQLTQQNGEPNSLPTTPAGQ